MTTEQYNEIVRRFHALKSAETAVKNTDYARPEDGDFLHNFYETANRMGVTPLQAWGVHWTKHNIAIEHFIRTGSLASETIMGRLLDASNYLDLAVALLEGPETEEPEGRIYETSEQNNNLLQSVKNLFGLS